MRNRHGKPITFNTAAWVQGHEGQWERFLLILCLVSCIHFFYFAGPVERSQSQSVAILHFFFVGGGVGDWFNALITSTYAWRNVYRDLCISKRGDECGSAQHLKGVKYLQVSLHHVSNFQKAIGTRFGQLPAFCHSKFLVDCRIQPGSLKLFLAKK